MPTINTISGELHNHQYILNRLKMALMAKDYSLIVIFPTLSLLHQIQDELMDLPEIAGVGGIRLLLFEGFIKEIGRRFGLLQQVPSALTRELLITEAFEVLKGQGRLDYLARAPFTLGYRQAILAGIAEWKRSCLNPDFFTKWAEDKGDKVKQLALLYQQYQQLLIQKNYSETDLDIRQLNKIQAMVGPAKEHSLVMLYGFTDLTPIQKKLMETLQAWFDFEIVVDPTPVPAIRSFIAQRFSISSLPEVPKSGFKNALTMLQTSFWHEKPQPNLIKTDDDSLQLLQTASWTKQAIAIAREIVKLLKADSAYSFDDFLILSPVPQTFIKSAIPVFEEYYLPLATEKTALAEYPIIKGFSQAMVVCDEDWLWPEMEVFIRQQYAGELAWEGDRILLELGERYGALSGKNRWLNIFRNSSLQNFFLEKNLNLIPLQRGIDLLLDIPGQAHLQDYLAAVRNYFSAILAGRTPISIQEPGNFEQQLGDLKVGEHLLEVIDEVLGYITNTRMLSKEMSLKEFQNLWSNYLLPLEVEVIQPSESVIKVLIPHEARGLHAKVVFITGLEQGVFPRNYINDWKLSLKDRQELRTLGVELETGEQYQTQEKLAFYWALQTAEERLYLVYQDQDSNGQPLNHTSYLDEINQWFPELFTGAKRYPLAPEQPSDFSECFSNFERTSYLAAHLSASVTEISARESDICRELLHSSYYQQLAMQIWQEHSRDMGPDYQFLRNPASLQLLKKIFGEEHIFAITALEDYRSCPYRFYLKQLLKVRPVIKPQLLPDQLELGNLYHQVLQDFAENFRGQSLKMQLIEKYRQILGECFDSHYREWQANAANDLVKLVLTLQETTIRKTLDRWLTSELDWAVESGGRFKICFLEFGFGLLRGDFDQASLAQPFKLEINETTLKIWGKVDRIDSDPDGNFAVYDYKSGRGPSTKELLQLDYLQLPVYLLALEELYFGAGNAVGGSYLGLKEPSRSRSGVWHQPRLRIDLGGKCLLADKEWQEWLAATRTALSDTVRDIRAGKFSPSGEECHPFCEYLGCCRCNEREVALTDEVSPESTANQSGCRV